MADDEKKEAEDGEAQAEGGEGSADGKKKSSKGSLKLLGGVVALIATGTILAVMATPSKAVRKVYEGPAMHTFFADGEIVGNPLDDNYSRYLKFRPSCQYEAYDLAYPSTRSADEHYETLLRESLQHTISTFSIDEVMGGTNRDTFAAELEEVAEPILFPVHVGLTASPYDLDPESGLRVGDSQDRKGTFRGPFHDHVLKVDAGKKTLQFGEGPEVQFGGGEYDLLVEDENGRTIYVDLSRLKEDFVGEVNVGVMGRIKRLFTGDIIAQ
ncbi:MAG: hypothetical protein AAGB93_20010 [Planctomycetota bacterium]